jgi:hypothetical protein
MNNFQKVDASMVDAAGFRAWLLIHFHVVKPCQNEFVRVRLSSGENVMMFRANKKGKIAFHPAMWDLYKAFEQDNKLESNKQPNQKAFVHQNPPTPNHFLSINDFARLKEKPQVPTGQYTIVIDPISNLVLEQGAKIGKVSKQEILQDIIAKHINEYVRKLV